MKCPYCNSDKLSILVNDNPDVKNVLTQVNIKTASFYPDKGLPVDVYGCPDCKSLVLKCPNL